MGFNGLTVLVFAASTRNDQVNPGRTSGECRGMCRPVSTPRRPRIRPASAWVIEGNMKNTRGGGPATYARDDGVRQPTGLTWITRASMPMIRLEIAHGWKRMPGRRSTKQ